jgi:hypothetical protein
MQTPVSIVSQIRGRYRYHALVLLVLFGSASLAFLWQASTASPVNLLYLYDTAHVLNQDRVIQAAGGVGYNVELYTTSTLSGNADALAAFCRAHVTTSQVGTVVIVIDTQRARLAIQDNGHVPENPVSFKPGQYQAAQRAFQKALSKEGFTAATVALLQELSKATSANRLLTSLAWWGAMLLDLVLVGTLLVLLLLPDRGRRSGATCESNHRLTLLR